ncbi:hypothetical protein COT97_03825 [Candidatus Falkowbacteria bacterium CG10_big_fil_rev_8_21_14_0_10_39_11]|uniref:Four helix bundle protein n=1 Tax=Candidatus Falkowbacteria bacterium CG10_big_fil_rev_8_21_14_0_10_39_11 TaxID=1974565 RepID=A0A2H0V4J0_9BACT|nr:MAG: hypothetical protein COT97_03825 [Candidatus Falkowbacteria bacterium CG10_big_fil_rev_8_21_14_0_10_39_11]
MSTQTYSKMQDIFTVWLQEFESSIMHSVRQRIKLYQHGGWPRLKRQFESIMMRVEDHRIRMKVLIGATARHEVSELLREQESKFFDILRSFISIVTDFRYMLSSINR